MATKYMGAKLIQKQLEKEKAKKAKMEKRTKGGTFGNDGDTLDRKTKRRFEITASSMMNEGDFEVKQDAPDPNPEFTAAYDNLRRNPYFLLTYDENLL